MKKFIDYIIYTVHKCLRGYFYTISFLSLGIVLIIMTFIKYLVLSFYIDDIENNQTLKGFFQLSVFLFIPVFAILVLLKYKNKPLMYDQLKVKSVPAILSWLSFLGYVCVMIFLFGYLLIA